LSNVCTICCTCSIHGEKETRRPNLFGFKASTQASTANHGEGKSRNKASHLLEISGGKPLLEQLLWQFMETVEERP